MGEAVVPQVREAAPSEEKSEAGPASLVSKASGTHASAVDSMGHAIVNTVTDEVGAGREYHGTKWGT